MKPQFLLTVDVEEDWVPGRASVSVYNIRRLPRLHELCMKYGIKPTYLYTYQILISDIWDDFHNRFQGHNYEIGLHLHPWSNPPFVEIDQVGARPYPFEYPLQTLHEKLELLLDSAKKWGALPRSYRAGRYGFAPAHIPILRALGITTDCSVTPFVSWEMNLGYRRGGPDYRQLGPRPFIWISGNNYDEPGISHHNTMLEVPVTILPISRRLGGNYTLLVNLYTRRHLLPSAIVKRLCPRIVWLRPFPNYNFDTLKKVMQYGIRYDLPILVMFLHSSELHEGCNPYFCSEEDVQRLFDMLEKVFLFVQENGIISLTVSEFSDTISDSIYLAKRS